MATACPNANAFGGVRPRLLRERVEARPGRLDVLAVLHLLEDELLGVEAEDALLQLAEALCDNTAVMLDGRQDVRHLVEVSIVLRQLALHKKETV